MSNKAFSNKVLDRTYDILTEDIRSKDMPDKYKYPTPSVGRIVHYVFENNPDYCLAAIITRVYEPEAPKLVPNVDLHVFSSTGDYIQLDIRFDAASLKGGHNNAHTWHWPERVE